MKNTIVFKKPHEIAVALGYALSQQGKAELDKYFLTVGATNSQGCCVCNGVTAKLIEAWYSEQGVY